MVAKNRIRLIRIPKKYIQGECVSMIKIKISQFLWVLPFFAFLFGYYVSHSFLKKQTLQTPHLVGKTLQEALYAAHQKKLSIQLFREQEDPDLPEGIVLDQYPRGNQGIKVNQSIFVTVSKKPPAVIAPDFLGQKQDNIMRYTRKHCLQPQLLWIKSLHPPQTCVAQYPFAGQELVLGDVYVYISQGSDLFYIVPDLKGCLLGNVKEHLKYEQIELDVFSARYENKVSRKSKVVDQKPMPGSIVDMGKTLHLQVQVE